MKIVVFGAPGNIGRRVVLEALARGHEITAASRDPKRLDIRDRRLRAVSADVRDTRTACEIMAGADAVVSAVGPRDGSPPSVVVDAARSLSEAARRAGVRRLVVVGGAGSLEVSPGLQLVDTPEFPSAWKGVALAHRDALDVYRKAEDLDWSYLSPAALMEPGPRTARYRTGGERLLKDAEGRSRISIDDFAVALLDEVETPQHVRQRFTVAY
jgi:putative NADH-flavin reductase